MNILIAIRISFSLPILFKPVTYNNIRYIDGGLSNNIPLEFCNKDTTLVLTVKHSNKFIKKYRIKFLFDIFFTLSNSCLNKIQDLYKNRGYYIIQFYYENNNIFSYDYITKEIFKDLIESGKKICQDLFEN